MTKSYGTILDGESRPEERGAIVERANGHRRLEAADQPAKEVVGQPGRHRRVIPAGGAAPGDGCLDGRRVDDVAREVIGARFAFGGHGRLQRAGRRRNRCRIGHENRKAWNGDGPAPWQVGCRLTDTDSRSTNGHRHRPKRGGDICMVLTPKPTAAGGYRLSSV